MFNDHEELPMNKYIENSIFHLKLAHQILGFKTFVLKILMHELWKQK
jgi:hypothetical protein